MTNKNKIKQLHFYNDAGHAWLKVSHADLAKMQVQNEMSFYSYMTKSHAYLEEDQDASIYLDKLKENNIAFIIVEHHTNDESIIRTYAPYEKPVVSEAIVYTRRLSDMMYGILANDALKAGDYL